MSFLTFGKMFLVDIEVLKYILNRLKYIRPQVENLV